MAHICAPHESAGHDPWRTTCTPEKGTCTLTVVVDHDAKRLVWAAPGRDEATLRRFFDALGADRARLITYVSADGADWRLFTIEGVAGV